MKRGKKGVFYMNFMLDGKRIFRSTGKYTKREAVLVEAAEKQKIMNEANMSPHERLAQMLLQDAADDVYETHWKHSKDAGRSYARSCNLVKKMGNIPLGEINDETVARFLRKLDKERAAPGTVNRYLASLKMILKIKKQDTSYIKLRKERKGRIRVISREEEQQILDLLRNTDHDKRRYYYSDVADLVVVLADTGTRLGEALSMTYETIDFSSNLISIWVNKGDRPRSIPMTTRVRDVLATRQVANKVMPFQFEQHQAQNAWRWVRKQMGLMQDTQFVLHALRHTCASRLVNSGIDLYVVKEWLGHSTIQVTEKYAHLNPQKLADAVAVLEL
jgi:integrase